MCRISDFMPLCQQQMLLGLHRCNQNLTGVDHQRDTGGDTDKDWKRKKYQGEGPLALWKSSSRTKDAVVNQSNFR